MLEQDVVLGLALNKVRFGLGLFALFAEMTRVLEPLELTKIDRYSLSRKHRVNRRCGRSDTLLTIVVVGGVRNTPVAVIVPDFVVVVVVVVNHDIVIVLP